MARIARGDRMAAAELFRRHGDAVYRYLRGCGTGPEDAEDLTQEVVVRALGRASSYRGAGSLEGWLIRIARTRAIDRAREEAARRRRECEWAAVPDGWEEVAPPEAPGRLVRLLEALPMEDREVIVLAKFLDFPTSRIAEVLEVTAGAARVRLHRALKRLADRYQEAEAP